MHFDRGHFWLNSINVLSRHRLDIFRHKTHRAEASEPVCSRMKRSAAEIYSPSPTSSHNHSSQDPHKQIKQEPTISIDMEQDNIRRWDKFISKILSFLSFFSSLSESESRYWPNNSILFRIKIQRSKYPIWKRWYKACRLSNRSIFHQLFPSNGSSDKSVGFGSTCFPSIVFGMHKNLSRGQQRWQNRRRVR